MRFKRENYGNIAPAGFESEEEYDDFGYLNKKKNYNVKPQVENFKFTLEQACIADDVPRIAHALESGSLDINCYLQNNWTPLFYAAFYGSFNALTYLLQNGADPTIQFDYHNVVMCICNVKSISCNELILLKSLKLLLSIDKIDINAKNTTGMTALMFACKNGLLKLVEYLVDHGADLELKENQNGETALFFAVRSNQVEIVKFLLSRGADKYATDKRHQTIHRIMENKNFVDIITLLDENVEYAQQEENILKDYSCWNKVMTELENGFSLDVVSFLNTLSLKIYASTLQSNKTTFKQLLTGNRNNFANMGIVLTPHQKLLATALKCFHVRPWSPYSLGIKKNEINAETVAHALASITRQLHVLDASLIYLGAQNNRIDQRKGQNAMNNLLKIKITREKIMQLLENKVKISKSDYIGPCMFKIKQKKNINDILFAATAIVLVLLRVV